MEGLTVWALATAMDDAASPAMPLSRRAKIFSPFDALRGFGDAITAKAEEHDAQGGPRPSREHK